jgi:hypothetical protein
MNNIVINIQLKFNVAFGKKMKDIKRKENQGKIN